MNGTTMDVAFTATSMAPNIPGGATAPQKDWHLKPQPQSVRSHTMPSERAHYHLLIWGDWRRTNRGQVGHGFDHSSTILESGGSKEFDHMVEAEDSRSAAICDGIITGLEQLYRAAIESEYLLQGVIKHNRQATADLLLDAQLAFWSRAKKWLV